jgi:hypothetical protein
MVTHSHHLKLDLAIRGDCHDQVLPLGVKMGQRRVTMEVIKGSE